MATFTPSGVTDIAIVMEASSQYISGHLGAYGSFITDSDKAAILSDVATYLLIKDDTVNIHAQTTNLGVDIRAGEARRLIRERIGRLMLLPIAQSSAFEAELVRG